VRASCAEVAFPRARRGPAVDAGLACLFLPLGRHVTAEIAVFVRTSLDSRLERRVIALHAYNVILDAELCHSVG